jgi:hypothetical protein
LAELHAAGPLNGASLRTENSADRGYSPRLKLE